jgi:predicted acetyltransferase
MTNVSQSPTTKSGEFAARDVVAVTDAGREHAPVIQNLMQLYTHDFSEFWSGTSRGDLNAQGLFEAYPLDEYWSRPDRSALLIWHQDVLAGFALVNEQTHSGLRADRNMAEFFILRKHRGRGVGCVAAHAIFSRYLGLWEVAIARKNQGALVFWRRAIERSANAQQVQEMDVQNDHWNGPVLRFDYRDVRA